MHRKGVAMNKYVWVGIGLLLCAGCARYSEEPPRVGPGRDAVVEAESRHEAKNVDSHYWKTELEENGFPAHVMAFPSNNRVADRSNIERSSPGVEYVVLFEEPGTYYLWVKGRGESGGASIIPGYDGVPLSHNADLIGFFPGSFSWLGGLHDSGSRAVLQIDSAGEHLVNFWMLEDGFRFDKFLITADANLVPE